VRLRVKTLETTFIPSQSIMRKPRIQEKASDIEAEFDQPLVDVIAGFIGDGESLASTARILEVSQGSLKAWAIKRGLIAPARTRHTIGYSSDHGRRTWAGKPHCHRMLRHDGEWLSLTEWAERAGIDRQTIHARLRLGWSVDSAITTRPYHTNNYCRRKHHGK